MKPSFLKFLNFQQKIKLDSEIIENLHSLLFLSSLKHKIDSKKLKRKLDLPSNIAENIFRELVESEVINIELIECPECGKEMKKLLTTCNNCHSEIDIDEYYANIDALLDDNSINLIKSKHHESKKADIVAREWEKQEYLSYVLIDLVDSENVQNTLGDQDYRYFFEEVREIIKFYSLSSIKGEYLILGEIGDCIKIAFTKKEDVLVFFRNFSKELGNRLKKSKIIEKYIPILKYFPKFSGIVDTLLLPSTNTGKISARSIISITLDGSIDFNSKALTKLFRLDSGISINNDIAFNNSNVSLWVSENFIKSTEYESLNKIEITVGKHEDLKTERNVGLLLFDNGLENRIENPKEYKR